MDTEYNFRLDPIDGSYDPHELLCTEKAVKELKKELAKKDLTLQLGTIVDVQVKIDFQRKVARKIHWKITPIIRYWTQEELDEVRRQADELVANIKWDTDET